MKFRSYYHITRNLHTHRKLRPYQHECVSICLDKFNAGLRKQAVSLPVGSGKTLVFTNLISKVDPIKPGATKVLVLAHREELIDQAIRSINNENPELKVGKDQGTFKLNNSEIDGCDVIVASVNTLGRKISPRLKKYDPDKFKMIIIDEAHHATAESYKRILDYFKVHDMDSHIRLWGCSATLRRADGISLRQVFDDLVYHREILDMIREGWLCKMKVSTVKTEIDLRHLKPTSLNDFKESQLAKSVNIPERNTSVIHAWMRSVLPEDYQLSPDTIQKKLLELKRWKESKESGIEDDVEEPKELPKIPREVIQRKATLVFATNIQHVKDLTDAFRYCGVPDVEYLEGETSFLERRDVLEEFGKGNVRVLVNCGIVTEGIDIPIVDCVLLARPTASPVLLQQMIGRGLRLHKDKENCLLLDFHDVINDGVSLSTVPTLFGLDPMFKYDGDLQDLGETAKSVQDKLAQKPGLVELEPAFFSMEDLARMKDFLNSPEKQVRKLQVVDGAPRSLLIQIEEERDLFSENPNESVELRFANKFIPRDYDCLIRDRKVLNKVSKLPWVRIGEAEFAVGIPDGSSLLVTKRNGSTLDLASGGQYEVHLRQRRRAGLRVVQTTSKQLMIGDLISCLRGCESFLKISQHKSYLTSLTWFAKWKQLSATEKQVSFLSKRGIEIEIPASGKPVWVLGDGRRIQLTKGIAGDLLTQIAEGAIGNAKEEEKMVKVRKRKERAAKSEDW